ncbi:hypothetical protein HK414_08080 [Ramlibacter terrae]|uniref:DUF5666 domain-containing protein n=1 Tax=Ramlibacter terrae TaxID=2732511 RepID=A0ABX6P1J7_9BURK|nr:hypothetical protein HK414_08080 [Ramlibacter terrae]
MPNHRGTRRTILRAAAAAAVACALPALAQQAVRLRGTIESLSDTKLVLRERSGQRIELAIPPTLVVTEVFPATLTDVKAGSFIGVGAMPQADGSQRAIAVTIFPEAMRGTGEGHRPFDFLPQSTMTNATVADVVAAPDGRRLEVAYQDGKKTIVVPPEAPVVSLRPGDRSLLAVGGGAVSLTAQEVNGQPTVTRLSAGRNGFAPPY